MVTSLHPLQYSQYSAIKPHLLLQFSYSSLRKLSHIHWHLRILILHALYYVSRMKSCCFFVSNEILLFFQLLDGIIRHSNALLDLFCHVFHCLLKHPGQIHTPLSHICHLLMILSINTHFYSYSLKPLRCSDFQSIIFSACFCRNTSLSHLQ